MAPTRDAPALSFVDAMVQLSFRVQGILAEVGARYDLTLPQARLIGVLRDRELSMQSLATYLELEKSSTTGLVDRAERRGLLIRRQSTDDRRHVLVTLSPQGRALAVEANEAVDAELTALADRLPAADRQRLAALAARFLGF